MKNVRRQTTKFYNIHAHELREYYEGIGTRDGDISLGFSLIGNPEVARVLEIGCSHGREAAEILQRTPFYTGIDASEEFIKLAKSYVPHGRFIHGDAVEYDYPGRYDLAFSFAALRHLDWVDMSVVLRKVLGSLRKNGVFYISLNYSPIYKGKVLEDELGKRQLYLYNPNVIMDLAGPGYQNIYQTQSNVGGTQWFEIALRKTEQG